MIIETSANELYRVRETGNPDLAHCWEGIKVKRNKKTGGFDEAASRTALVRKAGCRIVSAV